MAKPQGKCIFCEGPGLTKEHIFPRWARNLLAGDISHHVTRVGVSLLPQANLAIVKPDTDLRQGYLFNKTLRVVCKTCNTGWMSSIEAKAKNILSSLITGNTYILGKAEQEIISAWSCLRTAVFERDHPATAALTRDEYTQIFQTQTPPAHWRVSIARNSASDWQTRIFHWGGEIIVPGIKPTGRMNTQRTLIGMRNLAICTSSSTLTLDDRWADRLSPKQMHQIFPYQGEVDWEAVLTLDNATLETTAYLHPG